MLHFHVIARDIHLIYRPGYALSQLHPKDKGNADKYRVRTKQVTRQRKDTPNPKPKHCIDSLTRKEKKKSHIEDSE